MICICVTVTLILYAVPWWQWYSSLDEGARKFVRQPPIIRGGNIPRITQEFITPDPGAGRVHVASICELADERLAACWYGGSREGARDTAIYLSVRDAGSTKSWSQPRVAVDRDSASRELRRYVKKVGNPVLFADYRDRLWLLYVTIAVGGWSGSSLNVKLSDDGGDHWTPSARLTLSPFFNVSELVRNNPLQLSDASLAVPIYHECLGKFPEILWIKTEGKGFGFQKTRITGGHRFIQPSIIVRDPLRATAFFRSCSEEKAVAMARTTDGGTTWSEPGYVNLPNPDAGISAVSLSGQRILLAFNDSRRGRSNLQLALSSDEGATWQRVARIEEGPGEEFSYPYMIRDSRSQIHLVYTWKRRHIKHVMFNEAWISCKLQEAAS
ncbi:MAG: sialidase family protein [Thermodesulfobacteriota bacterium]